MVEKQPWDGEGYLGIQMDVGQVLNAEGGVIPVVRVSKVQKGSAAEKAGIQRGDGIMAVDERAFKDMNAPVDFSERIKAKKPGSTVVLTIRRDDEDIRLPAVLRRRPPTLNRPSPWGMPLELPDQAELDEADFREWLRTKGAAREKDKPVEEE